jgi:hypothetical protein
MLGTRKRAEDKTRSGTKIVDFVRYFMKEKRVMGSGRGTLLIIL